MAKPTCATCLFFYPFKDHELGLGQCKLNPPTVDTLATNAEAVCQHHTQWREDNTHEGWRKTFFPDQNFNYLKNKEPPMNMPAKPTLEYIRKEVCKARSALNSYLYQPPETRDEYLNRATATLDSLKQYLDQHIAGA
jgi:hypothetical protein